MKKKILIVLGFLWFSTVHATFLPQHVPVNGGIAIIPIEIHAKPVVHYKNKPVTVIPGKSKNLWLILVGVDINAKEPIQYLTVTAPIRGKIPFHINQKHYRTQRIHLKNDHKVILSPKNAQRVSREKKQLNELTKTTSDSKPFHKAFTAPLKGRLSSQYGLKRIYNGKPRNPHLALDIAAPKGTAVRAAASGTVINTGDYFYTGNTVFIEHGKGIISLYAHLNSITVKSGERIRQGEIIGTVGSTGRATGPHLHWGIIMNQTLINPLLFVPAKAFKPRTPVKRKHNV